MSRTEAYESGTTEAFIFATATFVSELYDTLAGKVELFEPWIHFSILEYEATQPYQCDPYCCAHSFY
jgi:hypothetical protein